MIDNAVLYSEEIAQKCVYGADFVKDLLGIQYDHKNVYVKEKQNYGMSSRKLEGFKRLAKTRAYYQQRIVG